MSWEDDVLAALIADGVEEEAEAETERFWRELKEAEPAPLRPSTFL